MFKNLRNKLAVLALVALGLAFSNAYCSQTNKTNGELIYNAIINDKLPDEQTGEWIILPEEAQVTTGQDKKEGTSNWVLVRQPESITDENKRKIKSAIKRLLENDDVVKYITIHNIASGHMDAKNEDSIGTIKVDSLPAIPQVTNTSVEFLRELRKIVLAMQEACVDGSDVVDRSCMKSLLNATKLTSELSGDKGCLLPILYGVLASEVKRCGCNVQFSREFWIRNYYVDANDIENLVDIACDKDGSGEISVPFFRTKKFEVGEKQQELSKDVKQEQALFQKLIYQLKMFFAAKLYNKYKNQEALLEATRDKIMKFIDLTDLQIECQNTDLCITKKIETTKTNGQKMRKKDLIISLVVTMDDNKQIYIKHFGPTNNNR